MKAVSLNVIPVRFCLSKETLHILNTRGWVCSFSGGKDSTALVTAIEYHRRVGLIWPDVTPRLVNSNTRVEFPLIDHTTKQMMASLRMSGWHCEVVEPPIDQRLYNRIFGIGNVPVHPGNKKTMRWCTRSTKIDPMTRYAKTVGPDVMQLSGVRYGESASRDAKLKPQGCAAGGECGVPEVSDRVYGPIIDWSLCKVIEWLQGDPAVIDVIPDLLPTMRDLVTAYDVTIKDQVGFWELPPKITAMRFGCIGCPAISNEKVTKSKEAQRHPRWRHLRRIYPIWEQCYRRMNRCVRLNPKTGRDGYGPLRMEARKRLFAELLEIQRDSGVTLVTAEDIAFIHHCWATKRYPRGWSEASEATEATELLFKD